MADSLSVSGSSNPYVTQSYTAETNDKNTISMTGFFQLLATQLQNQDMTNPMDNSEIMAQMVQMAMVQSMTTMSDAVKNSTAVSTQTYAAGLVGQEVTMAVTEENEYGQEAPVDVKYAKVEWVNFTSGDPTIKIEGDDKEYQLAHLVGMGRVPNPFKSSSGTEDDDGDDVDGAKGAKSAKEAEGAKGSGDGTDVNGRKVEEASGIIRSHKGDEIEGADDDADLDNDLGEDRYALI